MPYPSTTKIRRAIATVRDMGLPVAAVSVGEDGVTIRIGQPLAADLQTGDPVLDAYLREDSGDGERDRENQVSDHR